jgi:hypothetical protein
MFEDIKGEIASAPFIAILLDETTDMASRSRLSTMVRYVTKSGTDEEQFLGFNDMSGDWCAKALAEHVFKCLDEYGIGDNKLVSETYGGAAVMAGELNGLQSCVRQKLFRCTLCSLLCT